MIKQTRQPGSMLFRALCVVLGGLLVLLQVRLWISEDGFAEVRRLRNQVDIQRRENDALAERNRRLDAEVGDLKQGFGALEERARSDLGLISPNESFFVFGGSHGDTTD